MENHSKYGRNIYYHNDNELFLFQYIASVLNWKEKGVTIAQKTGFPEEQGTTLEFNCNSPVGLKINVRYPYWAVNGIGIKVNGIRKMVNGKPGTCVVIDRIWKTGDRMEIALPFTLRIEPMPDDNSRVAVMYGPLVLAGDLGPLQDSLSDNPDYVPVLVTDKRDPSLWIKPVDGKINTFKTINTGRPRDVELKPFYTFYDRRYSVYWDLFSEKAWKEHEASYLAEKENTRKIKQARGKV